MMNEAPVPHRGADRPCLPRLLFADVFRRAIKAAPLIRPPKAEELGALNKAEPYKKKGRINDPALFVQRLPPLRRP
ncbi:hypothetical protein [Brucella tritici]|uniref:hypothetical protein n=1 Tax=Brucella tritici TaxID=94626 RepID=UPI002001BF9A|nr:hypothetical protein [Brucella tritici]